MSENESQEGKLPSGPKEYGQFHTLRQREEVVQQEAWVGLARVWERYDTYLNMLAQAMDRSEQEKLEGTLREEIRLNPPEERAQARERYWQDLEKNSAYRALEAVRKDPQLTERYLAGHNGGRRLESTRSWGNIQTMIESLHRLDERLLNHDLIMETFGDNPNHPYQLTAVYLAKAFQANGLEVESPEFRLAMLSMLELKAKRHMMLPILSKIRQYSQPIPRRFLETDEAKPLDFKRKILENLMLGNPQTRARRGTESYREQYHGTEFYRGMVDLIQQNMTALAEQTWGEEADQAILAIKNVVFMHVGSRRSSENASDLWGRALAPIADQDFAGARQVVKDLILDNSDLYPEMIWDDVGLTRAEVEAYQEERRAVQEREVEERKRAAAQKRLEKETQRLADKDPALWEQLAPFQGKLARCKGTNLQVKIVGPIAKKGKGGFMHARIEYAPGKWQTSMLTYGEALRRLESEWVFPEED